jgi:hypothetical protein
MPAHDSIMKTFQPAKRRGRCIDGGRAKITYEYGEPMVPVSKSRNQAQASAVRCGQQPKLNN